MASMTLHYHTRTAHEVAMEDAREYLASVYLNTGCEEDEAVDFARGFSAQSPDQIYFEAARYEDM